MNEIPIQVGPANQIGKRLVIASDGYDEERDKFDVNDAFRRNKFAENVIKKWQLDPSQNAEIQNEILRQADAEDEQNERQKSENCTASNQLNQDNPKVSQATRLVSLVEAAHVELFHTPDSDSVAFASAMIGGHRETWRLETKRFKNWLQRLYWQAFEGAPNSQATGDAIGVLRGKALFEGSEHPVFVRLAELEGTIWLDLADNDWRVVEINEKGWRVVDDPPVRFIRPKGMLPLPMPERGGRIDQLRDYLNLGTDDDWYLLIAWLISTYRPQGPFPVLGVHGEQGSAKSTACRILRALVDPNAADLRSEPRDERDLVIAASNGWVIALENLSRIPNWLSDALCRLSTGGGFGTRELYSDDEEKLFTAKRPVLLNGITDLATRSDLLDRSIVIHLPKIPEAQRQTEKQLWAEFERSKPRILGALLDAVSAALSNLDNVDLSCKPRMADFAEWACAAESGMGCPPGSILTAYLGNQATANETAIETSIIAEPLIELMNDQQKWEGTATNLKTELERLVEPETIKQRKWPKRPHLLSGELKRIAPNLRRMGIDVETGKKSGRRFISVTKKPMQTSDQSAPRDENSGHERPRADTEASPERPERPKRTHKN